MVPLVHTIQRLFESGILTNRAMFQAEVPTNMRDVPEDCSHHMLQIAVLVVHAGTHLQLEGHRNPICVEDQTQLAGHCIVVAREDSLDDFGNLRNQVHIVHRDWPFMPLDGRRLAKNQNS